MAGVESEPAVEDGVPVGDAGLHPVLAEGPAEAAGMSQLQADHEVVGRAEALPVRRGEDLPQLPNSVAGRGASHQLVGIGPPLGAHGKRLASPDQLGAAAPEVAPAAAHEIGGHAVPGAVPALHRLDGEAVSRTPFANFAGLCQRRFGCRQRCLVTGERGPDGLEVGAEIGGLPEGGHPRMPVPAPRGISRIRLSHRGFGGRALPGRTSAGVRSPRFLRPSAPG